MFLFGRLTFCRTKLLIAAVQAQASRPFELGAALVSNVHSLFKGAFPLLATKIFCLARHGCRSLAKDTLGRAPQIHFGRADGVERTL